MRKQTVRAFSLGLMAAAICFWIYSKFFFIPFDEEMAKKHIEAQGMRIVQAEKIEKLEKLEKDSANWKKEKEDLQKEISSLKEQVEETWKDTYVFKISKDMALEDISIRLENKKIIDDAESFNKYMTENKLDRKIQTGKYIFYQNMPYEKVGEMLSNP